MYCSPIAFSYANDLCDKYENSLMRPLGVSFEAYKHGFRQFVLGIWRQPDRLWLPALPYDGFTRVPKKYQDKAAWLMRDFVHECFVSYSQQMHDDSRRESEVVGGFAYRQISNVKRKLLNLAPVFVKPVEPKKKKSRVSHKPNKKCNRMPSSEYKTNAHLLGRFGGDHAFNYAEVVYLLHVPKRTSKDPVYQSGGRPISFVKVVPKTTHAERDLQQVSAVERKERKVYKELPKRSRETLVKAKRDKRSTVFRIENDDDVTYQNGNIIAKVAKSVALLAAGSIATSVFKMARKAGNIVDEANKLIKTIKSFTKNPVWMIPIACIAVFFLGKPVFEFAYHVLVNVMQRFFPKPLWSEVSPHVADVVLQDGSDVAGKVMAVACVFSIFKGMKLDHRTMTEFIKRMSCLPRLSESLSTFTSWIVTAFEFAVNFFRGLFGKEAISFKLGKASQLDIWMKEVEKVLQEHQSMTVVPKPEVIDGWLGLVGQAHELRNIYRGTPVYRNICELYDRLTAIIKPYRGSINARNNYRVEPEMILLTGAPGIGKTVLTLYLCAHILKRAGLTQGAAEEVLREIWQKGCSEYWNGYAGQLALIVDDAFQMHGDKTDKDNDFINVIRAVSSWAFPLNFADVESKGAIYFVSQLIVATTNRTNLDYGHEMIHKMDAVYRRIGHGYELKLNPMFATEEGRLDFPKFQAIKREYAANGTFPWHVWTLEKHDFNTGKPMQIYRGLEELVVEVADKLRAKNINHAVELEDLKTFINAMDNQQQPVPPAAQQAGEEEDIRNATADKKVLFWRNEEDVLDNTLQYKVLSPMDEKFLQFSNWLSKCFLTKGWRFWKNLDYNINVRIAKFVRSLGLSEELGKSIYLLIAIFVRYIEFRLVYAGAVKTVKAVVGIVKSVLGTFWPKDKKKEEESQIEKQSNAKVPIRNLQTVTLQNGTIDAMESVETNCYYMLCHNKGESTVEKMGTGIFVCDTLMVYPEHFNAILAKYKEGDVHFVNRRKPEFTFNVPVSKFLKFKDYSKEELTFVDFQGVRAHRNITNSFLTEGNLPYCAGKGSFLTHFDVNTSSQGDKLVFQSKEMLHEAATTTWEPRGGSFPTMKLARFFKISACTTAGTCGSPLITRKASLFGGSCVIGLHIAGDGFSRAFSVPCSREMIIEAKKKLSTIEDAFDKDLDDRKIFRQSHAVTMHIENSQTMLPICILDHSVPMAQKTNFFKTQYHGILGDCGMEPALQRPYYDDGIRRFPMLNAVAPYDTPLNLYEDHFDDLVHIAMQKFTGLSRDAPRHIMDFDTAVVGDPRLEYFRSIPRSTAAGFPYSVEYGSGKKAFFGDGVEYDLNTEPCKLLRTRVAHVIDSAKQGVRLSHIFTDFLKDELRPVEKVKAGKTRLISASPLDYTIAFRMYFGCFMASVMRHHIFSGMAPGVCVFTEWDTVLLEMSRKGDKICAGDFKSFDCSEQPPLHWAILNYVNKWYNDGNDLVRKVLWLELVHSRHLGGLGNDQRYVYQWSHSLPSGHPFTTIVNSMYSLSALVYAVTKTLKKPYCVFWNVASALTYGDDNLLNASDDIVALLPVEEMARHMKDLGLTYTSDSKGAVLEDWRPANEVTFLKRGFLKSDGRVNAPLDLESFLYTFYFCKNKKLENEIFIDVMENALEELSMHEQAQWDEFAPRVYELLSEKAVPRAPCQRESYLELIKIRSDNWF